MKCLEEPNSMSFYNNMEIQHIEVFACDLGAKNVAVEGKLKSEMKKHPLYCNFSPYNFFRQNLVFEVNKNLPLSHASVMLLGKQQPFIEFPDQTLVDKAATIGDLAAKRPPRDSILDLVIMKKAEEAKGEEAKALLPPAEPAETALAAFLPDQPVMKKFEDQGGMLDLIKAAQAAVKVYHNEKLRELWSLWLSEIESFSQLPTFFSQFCGDREKEIIIYNLIEGQYDYKGELKDASGQQSPELTRFV